ncbi:permease [Alicyclobacillus cellulosilyticus]|uniref:Permease n=1 Tax=Alicyclobacillus cellulosilyticus TaxID=1003997 RepID=A0A917K9C6_9BACL|nr:permease [Alicyclobacillus cellulosilyticus]GGJ02550.1 permease [Alicyclobacillus cellulosilyticus]
MTGYRNFQLALYVTAGCIRNETPAGFEAALAFFAKHTKLTKAYLEVHRGDITHPADKMREVKALFHQHGIRTAGGITPTIPPAYRPDHERFMHVFCYTDEASRAKLREAAEIAASVFDEVILDDFFFTNCACDECIRRKGDKSWEAFRLELMTEVSENLIIRPAKAVNPRVKLVIKYPNWIESYQATGYNTETQPRLFDGVYTGTETRDPATSQQHIPRYGSYSLVRWFEHVKPGGNGGGWFDNFDCTTLDHYLEQANLTVFAKAREITLFCYSSLKDTIFIPAVGFQLEKLDEAMAGVGSPVGTPVYLPHHACGEDHLYDYLGMLGIPLEPVPEYPADSRVVLLTADAARDPALVTKMEQTLRRGGDVIITSGLLQALQGRGIEQFTTLAATGARVTASRYAIQTAGCTFRDFVAAPRPVTWPVLAYRTNATWQHVVAVAGENNIPVLMSDHYSRGRLFTLTVPDNMADLYHLPAPVLAPLRQVLAGRLPVVLDGDSQAGLFVYDDGSFIVASFRPHLHTWRARVAPGKVLVNARGSAVAPYCTEPDGTSVYQVTLRPSEWRLYRVADRAEI